MNFDLNNINFARLAIYLVMAIAGFAVLIRVLKFVAGIILGFVVTLALAAMYYFKIGF